MTNWSHQIIAEPSMSDSDSDSSDLLSVFRNLSVSNHTAEGSIMNNSDIERIVQAAVTGALASQAALFEQKIEQLTGQFRSLDAPQVQAYRPVEINRSVRCDEGLDVVKCLPIFQGDRSAYVSWRHAAVNAYEVFKEFNGSSKHYQAVAIIRNKIAGAADGTLTSFATPLNFDAIIARLDHTYADKRPIYLLEQEMSTLRQGNLSVGEYYDEVEKVLTLLTNKTVMTYEREIASSLNNKYRQDALRIFISGLKRSLSDTLFAARPADLPAALALAEELEVNRQRYNFAASFSKFNVNDSKTTNDNHVPKRVEPSVGDVRNKISPRFTKQDADRPEPMDVDRSLSSVMRNNNNNQASPKRPLTGVSRQSDRARQRINNLNIEEKDEARYDRTLQEQLDEQTEEEEEVIQESLHFLE